MTLQAPLCMEFSRQEYWSGLPCPPLGDLPDPGIEPEFLSSPASSSGFFIAEPLGQPRTSLNYSLYVCVLSPSLQPHGL